MLESFENNPTESDEDLVSRLIGHIAMPCRTEVNGEIHDIGDFYIDEAKRILPTIADETQRARLQKYIKIYERKS